jgi:outer membrane protein assembly factor BamA
MLERAGEHGVRVDDIAFTGLAPKLARAAAARTEELETAWSFDERCRQKLEQAIKGGVLETLQANGYFRPEVTVALEQMGATVTARVSCKPGELFHFGALDVEGVSRRERQALLGDLSIRSGRPFSGTRVGRDRKRMESYFQNRGHPLAEVHVQTAVVSEKSVVNVTFRPKKGPWARVTRLKIIGASPTGELLIKRALSPAMGKPYDGAVVEASKKRLEETGAFVWVKIKTSRPEPGSGRCELLVEVAEKRLEPTGTSVPTGGQSGSSGQSDRGGATEATGRRPPSDPR